MEERQRIPLFLGFVAGAILPIWAIGFSIGAVMPLLDLFFDWQPQPSPYQIADQKVSAAEFVRVGTPVFLVTGLLSGIASYGTWRRRRWARPALLLLLALPLIVSIPYAAELKLAVIAPIWVAVFMLPFGCYLYLRSPVRRYFGSPPDQPAA